MQGHPLRLADVRGQVTIVRLLRRLLARDRLPHALLFDGIPGCGRQTVCRALTAALLCEQPQDGDACGECRACLLVAQGNHPDVVSLPHDSEEDHPDSERSERAREQLKADSVRELIEMRVWESPLIGKRRVFILPSVERLQRAQAKGANALLKALEEPPPSVFFLLTSASAAGVMTTIRSRAQCYRLQPLGQEDIQSILERGGVSRGEAARRSVLGSGSHRGLWDDKPTVMPLSDLRELLGGGLNLSIVADVVAQLPGREATPGEVRRTLRRWLVALQHDLRRDLPGPHGMQAANDIERIERSLHDLGVNLQPRMVLEALALSSG